jgi:hypothetical protein
MEFVFGAIFGLLLILLYVMPLVAVAWLVKSTVSAVFREHVRARRLRPSPAPTHSFFEGKEPFAGYEMGQWRGEE